MRWIERAEKEIEKSYENGEIDSNEYHSQMNDLGAEIDQAADDAAESAREDYYR